MGLPNLELQLQIEYADMITTFEKTKHDDPEYPCCSCHRLHLRKQVTCFSMKAQRFASNVWQELKQNHAK